MRSIRPLALLFAVIIAVFVLVTIIYVPTSTSYSIYNNGWNGLSRIIEKRGIPLQDYSVLKENPSNKTLLMVLQKNLTRDDGEELLDFVKNGGRLIIMVEDDDFLSGFLENIRIVNTSVLDPLLYYKSPLLPVAFTVIDGYNLTIVLNVPVYIEYSSDLSAFLNTSQYSFADVNGNSTFDSFEKRGPFAVGVYKSVGLGEIFVVADNDVFINSMLDLYNNSVLLDTLCGNRSLYVDLRHLELSPIDNLKNAIYLMEARLPSVVEVALVFLIALGYYFLVDKRSVVEEKVLRRYGLAITYIIVLSVIVLLFEFDYVLIVYSVALFLLFVLRHIGMGLVVLTSSMLYLSRSPLVFGALMPLFLFYPFLYHRREGTSVLFLGPSSTQSIRVLGILLPVAVMRPLELLPITLLFASILIWSIWEYIVTGKLVINGPRSIVEAVLNEEVEIPIDIRTKSKVYVRVKSRGVLEEFEALGNMLLALPLRFSRLGLHRVVVEVDIWGHNRFSYRSTRLVFNVNVVPAIKKLLRILESSIGGALLGRGLTALRGYGVFGGEAREGVRGRGLREGFEKTVRPSGVRIRFIGEGLSARSMRGEYYGVREYIPGDNPRNIHWKKSLSKNELIVKEFSGGLSGTGGLGLVIVFADLVSSSTSEFDRLSYKLLSTILRYAALNPYGEMALFLTLPDGFLEVLRGEARSILVELYRLFREELLFVDLDYHSMSDFLSDSELEKLLARRNLVLDAIRYVHVRFYSNVLSLLGKLGLDSPTYYTIIHGRPTSFKYSLLRFFLNKLGYMYLEVPRVSFTEASVYSSVLASVLSLWVSRVIV